MSNDLKKFQGLVIASGVLLILLGVVVLGSSLWESFVGVRKKFQTVQMPGFHQLELKDAGLYGGVYQHQGNDPMPVKALTQMDVRILSKDTFQDVPVLMNTAGLTFNQFGLQGMPVFNFMVQQPGFYTISGAYRGDGEGPSVPITIVSQAAQNIKQNLIVGIFAFVVFLGLGIFLLIGQNKWFGDPATPSRK